MPDQTKTIGAVGKDYTTIAAWAADADVSDGFWKGVIEDNAEFNENVEIISSIGTPTIDNYIWLTVREAERGDGTPGTGARIRSTTGSRTFYITEDFVRIEYLEIHLNTTGDSDEAIRVGPGVDRFLVSRCIIRANFVGTQQDGVYAADYTVSNISIDHCIIYGFSRAGIHAQNWRGSGTHTWNVDYVTIYDCQYGISARDESSGTVTIFAYNTAALDCTSDCFKETNFNILWGGSNNAATDGSLVTVGLVIAAQNNLTLSDTPQIAGDHFIVNDISAVDLLLADDSAFNNAYGNAVDRAGSEPDPRQDFTIDIIGNIRSASPDIGANEYTVGGATTYFVSSSGSLGLAGEVAKHTARLLLGSSLLVGALFSRKVFRRLIDGSITLVGNISARSIITALLVGVLELNGVVSKTIKLTLSGVVSTLGIVRKLVKIARTGSISMSGLLFNSASQAVTLVGSLQLAGALNKLTFRVIVSAITLTGVLNKFTVKLLVGSLQLSGVVSKLMRQFLAGSMTVIGNLLVAAAPKTVLAGAVLLAGLLTKLTRKVSSGSIIVSSNIRKFVRKLFVGSLSVHGAVKKLTYKIVSGALGLAGSVIAGFKYAVQLVGSLTLSGTVSGVKVILVAGKSNVRRMFYKMLGRR